MALIVTWLTKLNMHSGFIQNLNLSNITNEENDCTSYIAKYISIYESGLDYK